MRDDELSVRKLVRRVRLAAAATLLAGLSACGDGGSGPTLAVQDDAGSAKVGGAAVGVHATVSGSAQAPVWTLAGPGSLSATSGADVRYLPPDPATYDADATVVVTATLGPLSRSVQIALAARDLEGNHSTTSRERSITGETVAQANGVFVAVGDNGGLARSTDGTNWTIIDTRDGSNWIGVAYGNSTWMVVAQGGQVLTSPDGTTWTAATALYAEGAPEATALAQLAFGGGRFVAAGATRTWVGDGHTWSSSATALAAVTYGNGVFVGANPDGLYVSADGAQWTRSVSLDPTPALTVKSVAFGDGRFMATDFFDQTLTSTDGRSWTLSSTPFHGVGWRLDYAAGQWWTGGADTLFGSTDAGATWTPYDLPGNPALLRFAASAQAFVAAGQSGELWSGADASGLVARTARRVGDVAALDFAYGRRLAATDEGLMVGSPDAAAAVAWAAPLQLQQGLDVGAPLSIAHDAHGVVVAVGYCWNYLGNVVYKIARSTDGVAWSVIDLGHPFHGAMHVMHDGQRFVIDDTKGDVYASADGLSWTQTAALPLPAGVAVWPLASGGGRYVVVGTQGFVAASTDLANWTIAPTVDSAGAPLTFGDVAWDGHAFVAVGDGGMVATSTDGLSWSLAGSATTEPLFAVKVLADGRRVAAGGHGALESSLDGVHWMPHGTRTSQALFALVDAGGQLFAAGQDGLVEVSTR